MDTSILQYLYMDTQDKQRGSPYRTISAVGTLMYLAICEAPKLCLCGTCCPCLVLSLCCVPESARETSQTASYSLRLRPAAMTRGLYPTVIASLACGASGFLVRPTMGPFSTAALRRTSMTSRRLLTRGGATQAGTAPRMASEHYDYLVIGGGSGGVSSARRAATYDAKVCVSTVQVQVYMIITLQPVSSCTVVQFLLTMSLPLFVTGGCYRDKRYGWNLRECWLCSQEGWFWE